MPSMTVPVAPVNPTTHHDLAELDRALRLLGYSAGYPFDYDDNARQMDIEDAANHACPSCSHPGMCLQPYHRDITPPSLACRFEAVCVCPECGNAAILL